MSRRSLVWVLAALLGIALTAGITWASSKLTGQRIGLSAEPISAGVGLAPRVNTTTQRVVTVVTLPSRTTTTTLTVTAATPTPAPAGAVPQTTTPSIRPGADGARARRDSGGSGGASPRGRDD